MKIVKPEARLRFPEDQVVAFQIIHLIEEAARACYLSDDKIGEDTWGPFIRQRIS